MNPVIRQLARGTVLENFRILNVLGGGGFSIVYLAEELETGTQFVIKEYMPGRLAMRTTEKTVMPRDDDCVVAFQKGRMMFFQEASTLATLQHENIVNVRSFFRANNTVYMALYYEPGGIDLQDMIKKEKKRLPERFILDIVHPLLDAMQVIHDQGYLHLDIKPGNVHIRPGNRPLLLDFGAVHQRQLSRQDQIGHVSSQGYSPVEQYRRNGYMGPWTDVYSVGATLYACMAGTSPLAANERDINDTLKPASEAFKKYYSEELLKAIDWAMEINPEERPQTLADFRAVIPTECEETVQKQTLGSKLWGMIASR